MRLMVGCFLGGLGFEYFGAAMKFLEVRLQGTRYVALLWSEFFGKLSAGFALCCGVATAVGGLATSGCFGKEVAEWFV